MSSFTEEQICKIVHKELKRIIDTGLMYTEEADMQSKNYPAVPKSIQTTPQQPPQPPQAVKAVNDQGVHWTKMPATETNKGPWEKTTEQSPQTDAIEESIKTKQRPQFVDGVLYWIIEDKQTGQVLGLGRRLK
jgi:hypothetical protein